MPTSMMLLITRAVDWGSPKLEPELGGVVGVGGDPGGR